MKQEKFSAICRIILFFLTVINLIVIVYIYKDVQKLKEDLCNSNVAYKNEEFCNRK